jgi:hypothetical protein
MLADTKTVDFSFNHQPKKSTSINSTFLSAFKFTLAMGIYSVLTLIRYSTASAREKFLKKRNRLANSLALTQIFIMQGGQFLKKNADRHLYQETWHSFVTTY